MSQRLSLVGVVVAVAAGAPSLSVASAEPLVVVVESAPGGAVDPVEVRRIIAAELRAPVRAPRDAAADDASDLLIVAVDRGEIRMSLRPGAAGGVSRAVPAPSDRKARLQSIGWLAGNLARDQVTAFVAPAPLPAPAPAPAPSVEPEPVSPPEPPPPAPPPATEPPPFADHAPREPAATPGAVVAAQPSPAVGAASPTWSLAIGGGPSALWEGLGDREQPIWPTVGIWYLEVQRRSSTNGLILGAVLDVGPDMALGIKSGSIDFIGGAALVGIGHRFGRTFVEATGGLGLEAYQSGASLQTTTTPGTIESQSVPTVILGLYLRGQATAGLALSRSIDLMASAGGHLGSVGRFDHFLTTSLGLRFRFQ
jgi:hypothetical protein